MLKEEIRIQLSRHSELIAMLAKIGAARGHAIWIGQREQRESASGLVEEVQLRDLVTGKPAALAGVKEPPPGARHGLALAQGRRSRSRV